MKIHRFVFLFVALAVGVVAPPVFAGDVPQFTALYQLSSVAESTGNCRMNFAIRLFNLSGTDVDLTQIRLTDPANTDNAYAEFNDVRVPARGSADRSASVTVPREEYDRWQMGGSPTIFLRLGNDMGDTNWIRVFASRIAQP